jgi:hypothetical protein
VQQYAPLQPVEQLESGAALAAAVALSPTPRALRLLVWAQGLVEGGLLERPVWLQFAVHAGNSATAWGDLLLAEQRSFSPASRAMALALALAYGAWLLLVRRMFGKFPYPVLNKLPFPWGFMGFFAAGIAVILSTFQLGKWVRRQMAAVSSGRKNKAV